ncbi:DUF2306 domain-containing protein [Geodermatophilus maliterrae]|uniref:DUF2306 domain-containing protein n=1 Tax=Geodermatophilus maliterrae TaxID=3162531 RepID=A0ABV3XHI9_9ACTN
MTTDHLLGVPESRTGTSPAVDRTPRPRTVWWRRPWIVPLALVVTTVQLFIWPPYLGLDPATATVPVPPDLPWKYPLLVAHIAFGSIALIATCLQLWPRLRRRRPALHRWTGRVYVFGGVLPAAACAAVLLTWMGGPGWIGRIALEVLWVASTVTGWMAARRRRWPVHRRYMVYSFALTMDAFSTRALIVVIAAMAGPDLDLVLFLESVAWCGWLFNLLVAHVWLERTSRSSAHRAALAA